MKRLATHDGAKPLREILPQFFSIKLCRDPRLSNKLASTWSLFTVPDPDLEMGGGVGGVVKVGDRSPVSVWSKNNGGGAPGPFRWIRHWFLFSFRHTLQVRSFSSLSLALFFHAGLFHLKKKYSYPLLTISKVRGHV